MSLECFENAMRSWAGLAMKLRVHYWDFGIRFVPLAINHFELEDGTIVGQKGHGQVKGLDTIEGLPTAEYTRRVTVLLKCAALVVDKYVGDRHNWHRACAEIS